MRKLILSLLIACACAGSVAGSDAPQPKSKPVATDSYIIGVEDVVAVSVWKDQELSRTLPVRPDGYITLPLVGDVLANGRTSIQVRDEITSRLLRYMNSPVVTVTVQEIRSRKINVIGEIMKPGSFPLSDSMTVIDAIALAGGFKEFAKESKIYVLRRNDDGTTTRLPFNYKKAIRGGGPTLALQTRDTVVVP
jgi:polysaccharide biosynthesis/export protein